MEGMEKGVDGFAVVILKMLSFLFLSIEGKGSRVGAESKNEWDDRR
jgi:hypothetical protein